ncbi:MAG: hypothetical protein J6X03_05225 [Bacilli bacterium]|nr:hypothetical protein [Bacilli bacterium]
MPNNPTYAESERFSPTTEEMDNCLHEIQVSRNRYDSVERVYDIRYQESFPYIPTYMELEDYDFYLRRRNPSCYNPFPIAIGNLADRFINIINNNLALLSIE